MRSLIVEYDLCDPGKNYDDLIDALKGYDVWAKITKSTWFIRTNDSCVAVRDYLDSLIDNNDRIFVAELSGVAAWRNVLCQNQYLKDNL